MMKVGMGTIIDRGAAELLRSLRQAYEASAANFPIKRQTARQSVCVGGSIRLSKTMTLPQHFGQPNRV
jgi:hypothetical protein